MPSPVSLSPIHGHTLKVSLKSTPCGADKVLTLKEFGSVGPLPHLLCLPPVLPPQLLSP